MNKVYFSIMVFIIGLMRLDTINSYKCINTYLQSIMLVIYLYKIKLTYKYIENMRAKS